MNLKSLVSFSLALAAIATMSTTANAGSLSIKGSDTILPLAQQWAEKFIQRHPSTNVSVTGGGSGVGIKALINGTCDIADASRPMKASEIASAKSRGFVPKAIPVALDGVCFVVNPASPLTKISVDELEGIYLGRTTDWRSVGGPEGKIIAVGRDSSSGTYGFVQEDVLKNGNYRPDMISLPSNNAIAQTIAQNPLAIGYIGIAYARKFEGKVKILNISAHKGGAAVHPNDVTVRNKSYPVARPLYNYTKGNPGGIAKTYIEFVLSPAGQDIVEQVGYVKLR